MTITERISVKINMLPPASRLKVLEMIDQLLEAPQQQLSPAEKAAAWEEWAKSHSDNRVIVDDSREAIYQD
jgi:hypothetical protein